MKKLEVIAPQPGCTEEEWNEYCQGLQNACEETFNFFTLMGIPCKKQAVYSHPEVNAVELYYLLNDENRLKEIIAKLKNKAFW